MRDVRSVKAWALSITMVGVAHAVACGGSSDGDVAPSAQAGTSQGSSGASGASGAGAGGNQGGKSGTAGVAGTGGSPAGSGGVAGASGKAGSAGVAGASGASGGGGSAGSAGKATAPCTADAECTAKLPITTPADCAVARCNKASGACEVAAKDADGDGHATSKCKANDATPIIVGDDCDDKDPATFKGAWDGPKGDGNPDRCDGVDQDCDGVADSGTLASGATCTCNPGDVSKCSEDSSGKPITFPTGAPLGACKYGSKTCNANGQWSACTGAIAPEPVDRCDAKDENCNGKVDMDDPIPPINQITFTFDGDDDNFADASHPTESKTTSCPSTPPKTCPSYLDTAKFPCTPAKQWKSVSLPLKDCGDNDPNVFPGAQEFCNDVDDDCNGTVDDSYAVDSSVWMFDYDGDGFGDINVKTVRSCKPPTTVPAGCVDVAAGAPSDYCQGKAAEGNPPACPPLPCDLSMWVKETPSTPHTDCKDRPDEYNPKGGYKPELVHPGGTDLCNGFDYGCDGTPNTGCGCSPVGITAACGDVATCNAGTQTCTAGGVWGACDGGDVKPRQDYCPDKDSDGYCDLNACQTGLCPVEVPAGFKLKALCLSFSDCNDTNDVKGAATHPAPADVCNGDGNDYNCNTVANTPGAGDCSCIGTGPNAQSSIACAPAGFIYPSGKNPGDPLAGVCVWGNQSCNPNGTLTACTGGVSGQATENCTPPAPGQPLDGKDYDCNGVSNTVQCACKNGDVQSCENVALCNKGCVQTCQNGQWGPFSIPAVAQIPDCHADVDLDGTCAATTAAKCPPGTWGNDLDQECSTDCAKNDSLARKWRRARNCIGGAVTIDCNDATPTARPYFAEDDSLACGAGTTAIWTAVANPGEEKCDFVNHDCFGTNADSGSCDDQVCWPSTTPDVIEWPLSHISGDNVIPNNAAKKVTWSFNFSKTANLQSLHFSSGLLVIEETVTDFTTAQRKNIVLPDTGTPVLHPGATIATITGLPTNQPVGQSWAYSVVWTQSPTATTKANLVIDLVSNGQIMNQFCRVQGADNCTAAPSSSMPACLGCELRLSSRCVSVTVNPQ